jgi:hypothetical protein
MANGAVDTGPKRPPQGVLEDATASLNDLTDEGSRYALCPAEQHGLKASKYGGYHHILWLAPGGPVILTNLILQNNLLYLDVIQLLGVTR